MKEPFVETEQHFNLYTITKSYAHSGLCKKPQVMSTLGEGHHCTDGIYHIFVSLYLMKEQKLQCLCDYFMCFFHLPPSALTAWICMRTQNRKTKHQEQFKMTDGMATFLSECKIKKNYATEKLKIKVN